MIENPPAVSLSREILAVPGVDTVYRPWDLSLATHGKTPEPGGSTEDSRAIGEVLQAAVDNGVVPGIACGGLSHVRRWVNAGFKMIAVNSDVGVLVDATSRLLRDSREEVEGMEAKRQGPGDGAGGPGSSLQAGEIRRA